MKTKISIIIVSLVTIVFTACTDKKKTEQKVEVEHISEEKEIPVEETIATDEKIRQDSIRQVKEHGHAH